MKQHLLLMILSLSIITIAQAQSSNHVRLYGYIQNTTGGMAPKKEVMDDSGKMVTTKQPPSGQNYYIYLSAPSQARVYPAQLWIKGQPYGVTYETKKENPVVSVNEVMPKHPVTTILVPKTNGRILQLTPVPLTENRDVAKGKALSANNELVVLYKKSGKFYYAVLKSFTQLSSQPLQ